MSLFLNLPKKERELLKEELSRSERYLEFGAGGSTILSVESSETRLTASIETDPNFLDLVLGEVSKSELPGAENRFCAIHLDVGPVKKWGYPVEKNVAGIPQKLKDVVNRAISFFAENGNVESPDLVLIDGRWRAASFAAVLPRLVEGSVILFDDYVNREKSYRHVEELLKPSEFAGRMAKFVVTKEIWEMNKSLEEVTDFSLEVFSSDPK